MQCDIYPRSVQGTEPVQSLMNTTYVESITSHLIVDADTKSRINLVTIDQPPHADQHQV